MTNLDSVLKSRDIALPTNVHLVKAMVSPVHVWMWELDHKEGWALKNWCFWTVVLEKTLESPLECKQIKPVNPKENQPWMFIGRTDAEAEAPILWLPDVENWLIRKDPDAGKDWGQKEKGITEDEMIEWHHRLSACGLGWTLGVDDGQGGLACAVHGVAKSRTWLSDWTELNWTTGQQLLQVYYTASWFFIGKPPRKPILCIISHKVSSCLVQQNINFLEKA